ncbi:hypothetical protein [Nocardioides anomalus]|uniref:hypothetical protein n=1 Tax=Nocardioides anomalus TaxID=2712223 RepID=UPI001E3F8E19|nr:hypothetical protein [Nocardioides anomalus]
MPARRRPRTERGAAAVEAALMSSVVLAPLLSGVLYWGHYFWEAQRVRTLDVTAVPQGSVAGTWSCSELSARVRELVAGNLTTLAGQLDVAPSAIGVAATVVRVLPDLGADVEVSVTIPVARQLSSLLPLPGSGAVLETATQRLSQVKVTTTSCL